ncbi:hypothetical protein BV389_21735 [Escherichia coli]|nr:hypothetical protein BV389_21735 [Escherichia coli]
MIPLFCLFFIIRIHRGLQYTVQCGADLLKIADILLGKMIFNRMQHKPGEGDKSQYRGQADKKGQPQSE